MKEFILILLILIRKTLQDEVVPRIMNGNPATWGQFPYQAFIYSNFSACGASIIHKRWLLTAAHCALSESSGKAHVGSIYRDGWFGEIVRVEKFIPHKNYGTRRVGVVNDIALIRLKRDLEYDKDIQPVELARDESNDYANVMATISGWGLQNVVKGGLPYHLQFATLEVISEKECTKLWNVAIRKKICTSGTLFQEYKGTVCSGDSGGPLVFNNKQIGVVSYGAGIPGWSLPDVYARVASYVPWIEKELLFYSDKL